MKKRVVALSLAVSVQMSYGQAWKEWFNQKKTQIEYLANQIAALKVYTDYLEKGYTIIKDGTQIIGDIKQGDFNLHQGYFTSLRSVNPAIQNYSRVAIIISDQATIIRLFTGLLNFSVESGLFSLGERQYMASIYANIKTECLKNTENLARVMTAGELEMKDDERLQLIDRVYADTKDHLSFTSSFCGEASTLAHWRMRTAKETYLAKKLYGY